MAPDQLPPAAAVMMLAAHVSRHGILTEWIDASILDETHPFDREPSLNLYDPANPNQPPYSAGFVARYRKAQVARNRRITDRVRAELERRRADDGGLGPELAFVVHGTMADPRWLDPAIDPSDRKPGWCYLGHPRVVNDGPVGLARFSTLRSWLSQWGYDTARGDALASAADVAEPVLVIGNTADDACTPSHTHRLFDAVPHDRKWLHEIPGANHYYGGPGGRDHLDQAVGHITDFLDCL